MTKRFRRRRREAPEPASGKPAIGWAEWIVGNGHWYSASGYILGMAVLVVGLRRLRQKIDGWIGRRSE